MKKNSFYLLAIVSVSTFAVGCQSNGKTKTGVETPKQQFHVMSDAQLHQQMRSMVPELKILLDIYLDSDQPEPGRRTTALDSLMRLNAIAEAIGGENVTTNFSVINNYMGAFLYDLGVSREFVEKTPPNYFPAGTLIKSCLACHQSL